MTHLLDTCVCIALIRDRSPELRERFRDFEIGDLVVSSITDAELRYGADKSAKPARNHRAIDRMWLTLPVVSFDALAAMHYGRIRAELERAGTPIGPLDLLIGAQARALGLTLVTHNVREFQRIPDLEVEDWGR